jgi:hypothetical protein
MGVPSRAEKGTCLLLLQLIINLKRKLKGKPLDLSDPHF